VEALDRYTVRFTMKELLSWFLEACPRGHPSKTADKGVSASPETVIGTDLMLERYEPNVRLTFVQSPLLPAGAPYLTPSSSASTRLPPPSSRQPSGQYDCARDPRLQRSDLGWSSAAKQYPDGGVHWLISTFAVPKLGRSHHDVRVRRALHMAVNLNEVIMNPMGYGHGSANPLVPAALTEWAIPIGQSRRGRQLTRRIRGSPAPARLAGQSASVPRGITGTWGTASPTS
jgi:hypothetical protein